MAVRALSSPCVISHPVQVPQQPHVKAEPVDNRYMLSGGGSGLTAYGIPQLPGPQIPGRQSVPGQQVSYPPANGRPASAAAQAPPPPTARYPAAPAQTPARIPQVDGPSSSSSESPSPPPSQNYAPRATHPSLPQPAQNPAVPKADDSEAINSDLDDSDSENEQEGIEGGAADTDIVFCTYDKVCASSVFGTTWSRCVSRRWPV